MTRMTVLSIVLLGVMMCISINGFMSRTTVASNYIIKSSSCSRSSSSSSSSSSSKLNMAATQIPTQSSPVGGSWTPDAWKKLPIKQPPNYPDQVSQSSLLIIFELLITLTTLQTSPLPLL